MTGMVIQAKTVILICIRSANTLAGNQFSEIYPRCGVHGVLRRFYSHFGTIVERNSSLDISAPNTGSTGRFACGSAPMSKPLGARENF